MPSDDTVYIASRLAQDRVYHCDADCMQLKGTVRAKPRTTLSDRTPCKACHGGADPGGPTDSECPLCGTTVSILADHIRKCPNRDQAAGGVLPDA